MVAQSINSQYQYNGNQALILSVDALYGVNCPFSDSNAAGGNVVNMLADGPGGTVVKSFLLFHKVQQPGTDPRVTTGFGVVRSSESTRGTMGSFVKSIEDPNYNVNGVDPTAIRVYGLEMFIFLGSSLAYNIIKISTTDGANIT